MADSASRIRAPFDHLPNHQGRQTEQHFAQALGEGKSERHVRAEPHQMAEADQPGFLHAEACGHHEENASRRLGQAFEHDCIRETDGTPEPTQCEPGLRAALQLEQQRGWRPWLLALPFSVRLRANGGARR